MVLLLIIEILHDPIHTMRPEFLNFGLPSHAGFISPTASWRLILYYTILYYTILYYTILYYTMLYYTILDSEVGAHTRGLWDPLWTQAQGLRVANGAAIWSATSLDISATVSIMESRAILRMDIGI